MISFLKEKVLENWGVWGLSGSIPQKLAALQLSSEWRSRSGKTIFLFFKDFEEDPFLVAKVPQDTAFNISLHKEYKNLLYIWERGGYETKSHIPRPIFFGERGKIKFFLETAGAGKPLRILLQQLSENERKKVLTQLYTQLLNWLIEFGLSTKKSNGGKVTRYLISKLIANFRSAFRTSDEEGKVLNWIMEETEHISNYSLPVIWQHGDLWSGSVLVNTEKFNFTIIDWENFQIKGLPLVDLLTLLLHSGFVVGKKRPPREVLEEFENCREANWYATFAKDLIKNYMLAMGINAKAFPLLFPLTLIYRALRANEILQHEISAKENTWRNFFAHWVKTRETYFLTKAM